MVAVARSRFNRLPFGPELLPVGLASKRFAVVARQIANSSVDRLANSRPVTLGTP